LINEFFGSILDIKEVLREGLESSIKDELIFDLNQVVTTLGIKSCHQTRDRNKIINDFLKDVLDTISFTILSDSWVEDNFSIL